MTATAEVIDTKKTAILVCEENGKAVIRYCTVQEAKEVCDKASLCARFAEFPALAPAEGQRTLTSCQGALASIRQELAAARRAIPTLKDKTLKNTFRLTLLAATTRTRGLDEFRHLARRQAVRMWTAHLALMATLALACTWLLPLVSPAEPTWTEALSLVAAFGLLGTVLTAGLLL